MELNKLYLKNREYIVHNYYDDFEQEDIFNLDILEDFRINKYYDGLNDNYDYNDLETDIEVFFLRYFKQSYNFDFDVSYIDLDYFIKEKMKHDFTFYKKDDCLLIVGC